MGPGGGSAYRLRQQMKLSTLRHRPLLLAGVATVVALVAAIGAAGAYSAITGDHKNLTE